MTSISSQLQAVSESTSSTVAVPTESAAAASSSDRKRRADNMSSLEQQQEEQNEQATSTSSIDDNSSASMNVSPSVPDAVSRKKAKRSTSTAHVPSTNNVHSSEPHNHQRRRDSKQSKDQGPNTEAPMLPPTARIISLAGMRYITPYCHPLEFFIKKRWWGRGLLDMLRSEYKNPLPSFYDDLLEAGRITLKPAARQSKEIHSVDELRSRAMLMNDRVTVRMHRHEPPVPDQTIQIIHYQPSPPSDSLVSVPSASSAPSTFDNTEPPHSLPSETIVINKPAGMPVHASGRYLHNTVVGILKQQLGVDVTPVHRLDRITSGLLLLSLTRTNARSLGYELQHRLVHKEYLARVKGEFPVGITRVQGVMELRGEARAKNSVDATLKSSSASLSSSTVFVESSGGKAVHTFVTPANPFMSSHVPTRLQPDVSSSNSAVASSSSADVSTSNDVTPEITAASSTQTPSLPDPSRVASSTEFEFVSFDGVSSLVKCRPLTGRTHQIRLHLSSLGFPIANDFLYGGSLFESNTYQDQSALVIQQQIERSAVNNAAHSLNIDITPPADELYEGWCSECRQLKDAPSVRTEQDNAESGKSNPLAIFCSSIWLHCSKYSGPRWSYHAPPPAWAEVNFNTKAAMAVPVHAHRTANNDEPDE